jgi:hypothetical protein
MMKHLIRLVIIGITIFFSPNILAQFVDDFTDGDITNNPTWTGMTSHFQVNGSNELWLNAPAVTSTSRLVTASQAIGNAQFDFRVRLDFDPSSSNYAKVYLTSTDSNLSGSLNGYYVRIGGASGAIDDVSLFHQSGITSTKIINGTNGTVALTPEVDVRVTRDMQGNWELLIDTALNGVFVSEGTVFNNQTIVSNYFGVYCIYTSTRSNKFFFDNFNVIGGPIMDIDPPVLDSAVSNSLTQVDVYFNEKVDQNTAETVSSYTVNNGVGNPFSATRDGVDTSLVHLAFTSSLSNNTTYNLSVVNVEDFSGNAIINQNTNFTTSITISYTYGDVVINEILADPAPQIGLPDAEFIELYNNTNTSINIGGWFYRDGSSTIQLPSYDLGVNKYVILCDEDDTALFNGFGDVLDLSTWPTLNNSGDRLGLRDAMHNLIDSVDYQDTWYQDASKSSGGWSLERINPLAPCSDANNWKASVNVDGGTPGVQNSIFNNQPNNVIPIVQSFSILGTDQIELIFSKSLDTNGISSTNFSIDNGLSVVGIDILSLTTLVVEVNPAMNNTDIYNLVINSIEDCYGNVMSDTTLKVAIGRVASSFDLVFTEIYPNPNPINIAIPDAEFVEIYNRSQDPIMLGGISFSDRSTVVNLPNEVIFPGEYAILVEDIVVQDFQKFGRVISLPSWPSLNNSGDLISLQTAIDTIDMVLYSDSWYENADKKSTGWSLELINPEVLCLGAHNWTGSQAEGQATPAQKNSVFDNTYTVDLNIESASTLQLNKIELVFSKNLDLNTVIPSNFIIDHSISVISAQVNNETLNVIELVVSPQLGVGTIYNITVSNILDCSGASLTNNVVEVKLPRFQDVLINEVLFSPNTGGSDFVELYNRTNQDIDLKNWSLLYYNNAGDSAYKLITSSTYILKPQQFVVLTEDSANIKYEYPNNMPGSFLETDLPTYSNSDGDVAVLNQMGLLNDQFMYNENMHFELLNTTKGVSLERINYLTGTNTGNNWHSAASTADFATPGFTNSQYLMSGSGSGSVSITPKTFSPNNDGYKDVLSITYQFNTEGYVATVSIHNAEGQLINTLINNQTVGIDGAFQWDGTNDNGELMPTGMYIVMMRVFDLENNHQVFKNVVVLAMP